MKEPSEESERMEHKVSLSDWQDIVETVSAFSNTKGGTIAVGIRDDGKVIGVEIGKNTIERLANQIKQNTDSPVYPSIDVKEKNGRNIIVITVDKSESRLVYAFGRPFKRVGRSNHRMGSEEIRKYNIQASKIYWDERICEGADLEDIDEEKIKWFLQIANTKRNFPISDDIPAKDVLSHLNLMKDNKITNAAILLFGKNPQRFHLQAETKCLHFHGAEIEKPFKNYHIYKGDIFDQVGNAVGFVLDRLITPVIPVPGKIATERPYEIPEFVSREAIVNAIAHRDYYSSAGVQVMVFSDRIEIWNPGELPSELTIEVLKKPHPSIPRNKLIAECFHLSGHIEKAGSGIIEMIKQCNEKGLPEPEFEEKMGCFVTTIWRHIITEKYLESLELNERQKEAIEYLGKKQKITSREYRELCNVVKDTAHRDLNDLLKKELIEKRGKGARTFYVLKTIVRYRPISSDEKKE